MTPDPSPALLPPDDEREALARIITPYVGRLAVSVALATADRILAAGFRRTRPSASAPGRWVACAERNPPDETYDPSSWEWPATTYLTFPSYRHLCFFGGRWMRWSEDCDMWLRTDATHWQPLMAPPAPGSDADGARSEGETTT